MSVTGAPYVVAELRDGKHPAADVEPDHPRHSTEVRRRLTLRNDDE